jgi:glucokinase
VKINVNYAIGIDIGGTTTKFALVDAAGDIHNMNTIDTNRKTVSKAYIISLVEETEKLVEDAIAAGTPLRGIGISVAGFVDPDHTKMVFNPNIPALEDYPLTPEFEQHFDLPVSLEVDSNSATLGEYQFGAGRGSNRFMCLTIGTGVGGGMTIDGRILRFAYECMGDMGHVIVEPGGPACNVGCRGCAEAMVSAPAIVRRAEQGLSDQLDSVLLKLRNEIGKLDAKNIIEAAKQGDLYAESILEETGRWLGFAMASLAPIFLPDCIAIAGGVSEADSLLLRPAIQAFTENSGEFYHRNLAVKKAELGWKATVLGAAVPLLR